MSDCDLSKYINESSDLGKELNVNILNGLKAIKSIGKGGFGKVYLVRHIDPTKENLYALKVIELSDKINQDKFEKEIKIFNEFSKKESPITCSHKYINCYLGVGKNDKMGCGFILMRFYNTDLKHELSKKYSYETRMSINFVYFLPQYIDWIKELMEVIIYLHSKKLAHGDIKPDNILINLLNNTIGLTDFDTVCFSSHTNVCKVSEFTEIYASPQVYNALRKDVSMEVIQKSDWWAWAIIILELWFGIEKFLTFFNVDIKKSLPGQNLYINLEKDSSGQIFINMRNSIVESIKNVKSQITNQLPEPNSSYVNTIAEILTKLLNSAVDILERVRNNKDLHISDITSKIKKIQSPEIKTQKGGSDQTYEKYTQKYTKYKAKYLAIKKNI
jgi:serine/threonine protein kinase